MNIFLVENQEYSAQISDLLFETLPKDPIVSQGRDFLSVWINGLVTKREKVAIYVFVECSRLSGVLIVSRMDLIHLAKSLWPPVCVVGLRLRVGNFVEFANGGLSELLAPKAFRRLPAVLYLAVDPSRHRNGIGRELLRFALEDQEQGQLGIKTLASTPENVAFYESCGFKEISRTLKRVFLVPGH